MTDTTHSGEAATVHQFQFTGTTREFFGIWLVNLLLTILTLGIYSAWAKVRTNRYFYNNTLVDDSAFDYTADPKKILAGRLIAVVLLLVYQFSVQFVASISLYVFSAFVLLIPPIIMSSVAFRMRYSQWRGISFSFDRDLGAAYRLFSPVIIYLIVITAAPLLFGLGPAEVPEEGDSELNAAFQQLALFSAVIALIAAAVFPAWQCAYYNFVGNRSGVGRERFKLRLRAGQFYRIYLASFGLLLLGIVGVGVMLGLGGFFGSEEEAGSSILVQILVIYLMFTLIYAASYALLQTYLGNAIYSGLSLSGVSFECRLRFGPMLYYYLTNTIAILLTLGFAIPWARIRVARYRASCMRLTASSLDHLTAQAEEEVLASADAMSDLFDLDIGL